MALHLIPIARFLKSTKLLVVIAESSMSPPTFKGRLAQQASNSPSSGILRQQLARSTTRHSSAPKLRKPTTLLGLIRVLLVTMCILCLPPCPFEWFQQGAVIVVRDVLREREQIVAVCSSQSLYYRSAAWIHQ
ncbi:hypothetical protein PENNAL_c0033G07275 [Penicillium nalgiovense]|uniref:Uncharacterized protein n=1 Tax=Penicillium nalgiovense TaxID=60175 RepID=A0A1V6Y7J4_PENNA|nr:hypothetical protein PENNAL_c0033G07275 [Penicillium nalgiovense]